MKFGKELKERSVREWEENYMSYKRLKRIIKKLIVQMKEREEILSQRQQQQTAAVSASSHHDAEDEDDDDDDDRDEATHSDSRRQSEEAILTRDARKEFMEEVAADLQRVNSFFVLKKQQMDADYERLMEGGMPRSSDSRRQSLLDSNRGLFTPTPRYPSNAAAFSFPAFVASTPTAAYAATAAPSTAPPSLTASILRPLARLSPTLSPSLTLDPAPPFLARSITTSLPVQLSSRSAAILGLYRRYLHLLSYSFVNQQGFIKIMKKFDKYGHESQSDAFKQRLEAEELVRLRPEVEARIEGVEDLYMRVSIARNVEVKKVRQVLRAVQRDVEEGDGDEKEDDGSTHSLLFISLAVIITVLLSSLPLLPLSEGPAHRCLLLLALVTCLWVTEAVPFFVTGMLVPLLCVLSGILTDANGQPLPADKASKAAFGVMFSDSVVLILGGFSISAAFSKCQYELRIMALLQRHLGDSPRLFLLAYMMLAAFLSMLISNVACPILLTTLLLPIIRDLQRNNVFARTLLLALAFSCNVGGMMSPIASPENAIVLGYLEERNSKHSIGWLTWMKLSIPIGVLAVLIIWLYLCLALLRHQTLPPIPPILIETAKVSRNDLITAVVTLLSLLLWCSLSYARHIFGVMATVAIIPLVVFFAVGILSVPDVRGFSWHLILLIAGGNVLGEAVRSSRLLALLTDPLIPFLSRHDVWVVCMVMLVLIFVMTSFVPHTVAALILTPVVIAIGSAIHHSHSLVFTTIFMLNLTMSLPISTFPNINSWLVDDDFHRPFLHARDFVRHGVAVSLLMLALMSTAGYGLLRWTFGKSLF